MSTCKLDQVSLFFTQEIIFWGLEFCLLYLEQFGEDHLLEEKEVLKLLSVSFLFVFGLLCAMDVNKAES